MSASGEQPAPRDAVNVLLERAYGAACRGDANELEEHLARLQAVGPREVDALAEQLRKIAECARAHPSYPPSPASREERATG